MASAASFGREARSTRLRRPRRGGRGRRPSQIPKRGIGGGAGRRLVAVTTALLGHRFVDGFVEVVAKVVAHLLTHALHEATDAGGIGFLEIAERPWVGERLPARFLGPPPPGA